MLPAESGQGAERLMHFRFPLEVTAVGEGPTTAPCKAEIMEYLNNGGMHSDSATVGVRVRIDVDGDAPAVARNGPALVPAANLPGVVAPAAAPKVAASKMSVGAGGDDLLHGLFEKRPNVLVTAKRAEQRKCAGLDVVSHPLGVDDDIVSRQRTVGKLTELLFDTNDRENRVGVRRVVR